ncbi:uncharacterized protein LOC104450328 [Eucalyptus grandis]|uniref:Uncharacterized protein n=2 Tax=Eucalyptus grandis TaxID=71139 RepID=A0ACC3KLS7_EUCGR|nr:uncharacterized protein LOC104450328 [Eucalyptus grandis]KAK3427331.1 hypothetical protein EUGRSUZ_F03576 [Eucalyptus grandis]
MAAVSCPSRPMSKPADGFSFGTSLKTPSQFRPGCKSLSFASNYVGKVKVCTSRKLTVQASNRDGGRSGNTGIFIGGFVLGGIVMGTLGCVYAPQISMALAGTDKKELMKKLPKFIYDEDKALEKTRKVLAQKIAQLNSAIDDVSAQLQPGDTPNGAAVPSDEVEAST